MQRENKTHNGVVYLFVKNTFKCFNEYVVISCIVKPGYDSQPL